MSSMSLQARVGSVLVASLLIAGCATADTPTPATAAPESDLTGLIPIRNARVPIDGVLSGGQPTPEQIERAADAGFRTVINLRTEAEKADGYAWEPELVEQLGMRYVHIPVAGAKGLTRDNIERIDQALTRGLEDGPVLFHCASGNRIGASLALRAAWIEGVPAEDALAFGQEAGMTRLTNALREVLELPPEN
jgi:uncharacterized protein (TIGR01244 family)